jgi:xanthine dehydrogenase/oxidase
MNKKLVFKILLPSLNPKTFSLTTYKIMPMAQNTHAYVNAAFLYEFNNSAKEKVLSANLCFGGIDPSFLHATKTEKFLVGTNIYNADVLNSAINLLSCEINPDWVLPDATPGYRKNLAVSLFYKSILKTSSDDNIDPIYKTGGSTLVRPLSSGTQKVDTHEKNWPLTKCLPKIEGIIQSAGEAQFANDIPHQPNEVWGAFVEATKVNHVIENIDATEALVSF